MRMKPVLEFAADHTLPPPLLNTPALFEYLMRVEGQVFREVATRQTVKVRFGQHNYFIKRHEGVGWLEIIKNWVTLKRPVVSALNEVRAIQALNQLNIPTTPYVGHGVQGWSPASLRSFVMTEDLGDIVTLEELALQWQTKRPRLREKRAIIRRVAEIAHLLHKHGIYHRDFYICHFCFKRKEANSCPPALYVLDLHRVEIRPMLSVSMQIKDLAALYFSAMDAGLSRGDWITFLKFYQAEHVLNAGAVSDLWGQVQARADQLYGKYQRKLSSGIAM